MAFKINDNSGWINENLQKEQELADGNDTAEKWADFRGTINVNGKEFEICLWKRVTSKGNKAFSASIGEPFKPEAKEETVTPRQKPKGW